MLADLGDPSSRNIVSLREQAIELRDRATPERLMPGQPLLGVAQRLATQCKAVDASLDGTSDETGLFEDPQMLGNRWLGRLETAAKIPSPSSADSGGHGQQGAVTLAVAPDTSVPCDAVDDGADRRAPPRPRHQWSQPFGNGCKGPSALARIRKSLLTNGPRR